MTVLSGVIGLVVLGSYWLTADLGPNVARFRCLPKTSWGVFSLAVSSFIDFCVQE